MSNNKQGSYSSIFPWQGRDQAPNALFKSKTLDCEYVKLYYEKHNSFNKGYIHELNSSQG